MPRSASQVLDVQVVLAGTESAVPPMQLPLKQVSAPSHTSPSGHGVPVGAFPGDTQTPLLLQASAPLQMFESGHGVPAGALPEETQVALALHVSVPLHKLLSEQELPAASATWLALVPTHESFVHGFPSSSGLSPKSPEPVSSPLPVPRVIVMLTSVAPVNR
ncbi:MAG: hypothetical protein ACRELY_31595 [Polyangiaceae bacterium]